METTKELVNKKIDYLTNMKKIIDAIEVPNIVRPTGKKAFIEFRENLLQALERVIDSEIDYRNMELKYYIAKEKLKIDPLLREIINDVEKKLQCNCDPDNWDPDQMTGHSYVCHVHKRVIKRFKREKGFRCRQSTYNK